MGSLSTSLPFVLGLFVLGWRRKTRQRYPMSECHHREHGPAGLEYHFVRLSQTASMVV